MKKKTHRTERRGRKPGDGVLKNIDPKSSLLEKQVLLTYGRTAGNRLAERVRWFRFRHGRDMAKDSRNREFVDKRTRDLLERFQQQMVNALWDFKPDWFQAMADAIRAEKTSQDTYPLQKALLEIHGAPKINRADLIYPENATGKAAPLKPRYTIAELCAILKRQGKRPASQEETEWQRTVRRACDEAVIPYLPGKPGRRRKTS